jgi:hypothetical protein
MTPTCLKAYEREPTGPTHVLVNSRALVSNDHDWQLSFSLTPCLTCALPST